MALQLHPAQVTQLIRDRKSVTPDFFTGKAIPKEIIEQLLENATWAPTHKKTQPWFFKVFRDKGLERLGNYLSGYYQQHTPAEKFSEIKWRQNKEKPLRSACVIAICMNRSTAVEIPEWEEIAAVACAVQNLWLSATAYGLSGYWSSPEAMIRSEDFLGLKEDERCLGIFYLGHADAPESTRKRIPLAEKISWVED